MLEHSGIKAIAIHGGAGGIPETEPEKRNTRAQIRALTPVIKYGWDLLNQGHSAVDVAAFTTARLERWKVFNAGYGAALNEIGEPSLDASIMDGSTDAFAAVIDVTRTPYPSLLARQILLHEPHKIYTSRGADIKAEKYKKQGVVNIKSTDQLKTPYRQLRWEQWKQKQQTVEIGDTVGVIVFDGRNMAVCSSTGGTNGKEVGRVGDVPLVGTGIFATQDFGACATGHGESIIRQRTAYTAIDDILNFYGPPVLHTESKPEFGALFTMTELQNSIHGRGGVILLDADGNFGAAHTSDTIMTHAYIRTGMDKPLVRRRGQIPTAA